MTQALGDLEVSWGGHGAVFRENHNHPCFPREHTFRSGGLVLSDFTLRGVVLEVYSPVCEVCGPSGDQLPAPLIPTTPILPPGERCLFRP